MTRTSNIFFLVHYFSHRIGNRLVTAPSASKPHIPIQVKNVLDPPCILQLVPNKMGSMHIIVSSQGRDGGLFVTWVTFTPLLSDKTVSIVKADVVIPFLWATNSLGGRKQGCSVGDFEIYSLYSLCRWEIFSFVQLVLSSKEITFLILQVILYIYIRRLYQLHYLTLERLDRFY